MDKELLARLFKYTLYVDRNHWKDLPDNNRLRFGKRRDEGGIFFRKDCTIIAIDGSSKLPEWIGNFLFFSNRQGFHRDFYRTALDLFNRVKDIIPRDKPVYVVGYSRGGGIAVPLMWLLKEYYDFDIKGTTWGAPRSIKKKHIGKLFGLKIIRVKAKSDPVPHVPFQWQGFIHYDTELIVHEDIKWHTNYIKKYAVGSYEDYK